MSGTPLGHDTVYVEGMDGFKRRPVWMIKGETRDDKAKAQDTMMVYCMTKGRYEYISCGTMPFLFIFSLPQCIMSVSCQMKIIYLDPYKKNTLRYRFIP